MTYLDFLTKECGYKHIKMLPDGRHWAAVHRYLFTCAIIIGEIGNTTNIADRWCYENEAAALAALEKWNGVGEPEGWHRHPYSGRRRTNGDPLKQYINP